MKHGILFILLVVFSGCLTKSGVQKKLLFGESEYGLTVDWIMAGQTQSNATLKAVRLLNQSEETYTADAPVTLPAAVPQSLTLMGEFPREQIHQEIDFIRGSIRFGGKTVQLPAQLVNDEDSSKKRRLTFQITGLNAAFRTEKSSQGRLQIEIFSRSRRLGVLETTVRTPPSELKFKEIPIKTWESMEAQGNASEHLKPIIAGKQINLLRILNFSNSESIPVQIQTPRRPKGSMTQWTNRITYNQALCSYTRSDHPSDDALNDEIIILPLDARFITEAEEIVRTPEMTGNLSTIIQPGRESFFGIYAIGAGATLWMNGGPLKPEVKTVSALARCRQVCRKRVCEPTPRADRFSGSSFLIDSCECEAWVDASIRETITTGVDRGPVLLRFSEETTKTPMRFSDVDPNKDGEIRYMQTLSKESEVTWFE